MKTFIFSAQREKPVDNAKNQTVISIVTEEGEVM